MTAGDPICSVCGRYSATCMHNKYPHANIRYPSTPEFYGSGTPFPLEAQEYEKQLAHQQDIIRWLSKAVVSQEEHAEMKYQENMGSRGLEVTPALVKWRIEEIAKDDCGNIQDEEVKLGLRYIIDESGLLEDAE